MYDDDLTNLEEWLRRLKIEYHIFFTGNRKKPPDDLRLRVERLVKKLSDCGDFSLSQRFRFNTLVTRFYVYRDLWRRTLTEKEMGMEPREEPASRTKLAKSAKAPVETVRITISDPSSEEGKVRLLYEAMLRIKGAKSRETPISYPQFVRYIATQTRGIREKYRCSAVVFTLALEENAIRFTAAADSR
ncbi:MAG: hypothetical protein H6Q07_3417 [Acidobacteria bacterium]|jgi:hypothetical protein|nr:hypothetical protein [Acidobacteriota bacterium]